MSETQVGTPPLRIDGLRVALRSTDTAVVEDITLSIAAGEVLGLVGESGCGKTTVGQSALGYFRPGAARTDGAVLIGGQEINQLPDRERRRLRGGQVTYVPQDPATALNPARRVGVQLDEMLRIHLPQLSSQARQARIRELLDEVALSQGVELLRRYPHELSGGQQQRVAIAMAFACRPRVIVCDEPTTGLDVMTQTRVLRTIRQLCRDHRVAALYVSHDLAVVAQLADRVAVMYAGRIVEQGTRDQIFGAPAHPYTRALLRAMPDLDSPHRLRGVKGHAPRPGEHAEGCSFSPRCPLATSECLVAVPESRLIAAGHTVRCVHAGDVQAGDRTPLPLSVAPGREDGHEVLAVSGLSASYGSRDIIHDITLSVRERECLALVGESGSGKTTFARCIGGLHRDQTGEVRLLGEPLRPRARARSAPQRSQVQYVFQNPYGSLNPRRTIGQTLARQMRSVNGASRSDARRGVFEALEQVSLAAGIAERRPGDLSGGERQRVAVARALIVGPRLLICDEITSALDVSVQASIIEMLTGLQRDLGLSLLFVTHDLALVRSLADRVAVMRDGRIVEQGATEEIFTAPSADYTRDLLAHTPTPTLRRKDPSDATAV